MGSLYCQEYMDRPSSDQHIDRACNILKSKFQLDAIAVSGMSGVVIGSVVAHKLGINLIVIRKRNERCHSVNKVEYVGRVKYYECRYVILDDFMSSGETVKYMCEILQDHGFSAPVGLYMYNTANGNNSNIIDYLTSLWDKKIELVN